MGTPPMVSPIRMLPLLLVALAIRSAMCNESGPIIVEEPDSRVDVFNSSGANIRCTVRGHPKPSVVWVRAEDGTAVSDFPGLRRVLANGILRFPPFQPKDYRQEVHAQVYRCQASNPHGSVHSHDVHVRGVVAQPYETQVSNEFVIQGNTAILKCSIPSFVADFVTVQAWLTSDGMAYYPSHDYDGKYLVLPSGELHIRSVSPEDSFKSYKCRTIHRLTQETRLSATAGRLVISTPWGHMQPRLSGDHLQELSEKTAGSSIAMLCPAQAFPHPDFRWFKFNENGRKASVELGERIKQVGGTLIIREAKVEDSGKYLCVVNNSVGGESVETVLTVTAPLSAQVEPKVQTVEFGRPATFTCTYRGNPVKSVSWLKDGTPIEHKEAVLHINSVGREDKGMYQCFVRNDQESAQATAELKLGGRFEPPQLTYTFETSTLQPGSSVYLNCVAAGNPTPEITWELDGTRLSNSERMQVGQYVTVNGEVVSHLNISGVLTNDGGQYACVASSTVGSVKHAARLNVYGLPNIRPMDKVAVVAGENMIVHCPVAGYPIDSIVWEKNGRMLPINRRQHPHDNGTLLIEAVERSSDQGRYTCVARNSQGYTARGDLDVQVMEPPQTLPIEFGSEAFYEGDLAQAICRVRKGDLPLTITWLFNGVALASEADTLIAGVGARTSILTLDPVRGHHQGTYVCIAQNSAGQSEAQASLIVNGTQRKFKELVEMGY